MGSTANVNANALSATSVTTGGTASTSTGSLLFNVYSAGSMVGSFTLSASSAGTGSATFATTNPTNGITSDGAGLEFPDTGTSGALNAVNSFPNYTNGAPVCVKLAHAIAGSTTLSIEVGGANPKTLQLLGGPALATGDASANDIICMIYDTTGAVWNVASPLRSVAYVNRTQTFAAGQNYGTPSSITLTNATGLPLSGGVTGTLGLSNGGTAASLAASNGGLVYSTASALAILPAAVNAKQIVLSGGAGAPTFSDFPDWALTMPAASCNGSTATALWSTPATGGFTPVCYNSQFGVFQATPSVGAVAYFQFELPSDWDSASQAYVKLLYSSGANSSNTVQWTLAEGCIYNDGAHTDAPAYNSEFSWAAQTMAAIHIGWAQSGQLTKLTSALNCVPGATVNVRATLSGSATGNINLQLASVTIPRLLTFQAN